MSQSPLNFPTWSPALVASCLSISIRECPVCGSPMVCKETGRGRKRLYCSDDCRLVKNAIRRLDSLVARVQSRCSETAWRSLRGEVFGCANGRGISQKRLALEESSSWSDRVQEAIPREALDSIQETLQTLVEKDPGAIQPSSDMATSLGLTLTIPTPPPTLDPVETPSQDEESPVLRSSSDSEAVPMTLHRATSWLWAAMDQGCLVVVMRSPRGLQVRASFPDSPLQAEEAARVLKTRSKRLSSLLGIRASAQKLDPSQVLSALSR